MDTRDFTNATNARLNMLEAQIYTLGSEYDNINTRADTYTTITEMNQTRFELLDLLADLETRISHLEDWCLPHQEKIDQKILKHFY